MTMEENGNILRRHGLYPVSKMLVTARREACRELMRAFEDGADQGRFFWLSEAAARLRDVFSDIAVQAKGDWFLTSSQFAHPSMHHAETISNSLHQLVSLLNVEKIDQALSQLVSLRRKNLPSMLEYYLSTTRAENPMSVPDAGNWVLMLASYNDWGTIYLDSVEGTVESAIVGLEEINPELAPFGITAAWKVRELDPALECVRELVASAALGDDFFAFNEIESLKTIKEEVGNLMWSTKLLSSRLIWQSPSWPVEVRVRPRKASLIDDTDIQLGVAP